MNDKQKIDYLGWDAAFGILTRPALELSMSETNGVAVLYVIDFNDIHKLNVQKGYDRVNSDIRESLAELKKNFSDLIIGRVFSGDEIAILDAHDHLNLIPNFAGICMGYKLGFRWADTVIDLGRSVADHKEQLDTLSQKLQKSHYAKML